MENGDTVNLMFYEGKWKPSITEANGEINYNGEYRDTIQIAFEYALKQVMKETK